MKWILLYLLLLPTTQARAEKTEANIDIFAPDKGYEVSASDIRAAIQAAARATSAYYGKFPVPQLKITVQPLESNPHGIFGRSLDGVEVVLYLGRQVKAAKLKKDWILAHEMFHLGFPTLEGQEPDWIGEGLATYQEPLARTRAGMMSVSEFWEEAIDGLTDAQARPGEGGLDSESRYRRIYWGGAQFWLLIDLEIREKSANKKNLDDALILIWKDGGTAKSSWSLKKFMTKFDAAVGYPIIKKYHQRYGPKAPNEDLAALFNRLGVKKNGSAISFDDTAPLAKIRASLTALKSGI